MIDIQQIDHVAITVRDVEKAESFYSRIGFERVLKIPRATFLRHGEAILALFPANPQAREGKARGAMDRSAIAIQHLAFRVADGTLETWRGKLEAAGIATRGPLEHEINCSLYFEDPDGHQLELTHPNPNFSAQIGDNQAQDGLGRKGGSGP